MAPPGYTLPVLWATGRQAVCWNSLGFLLISCPLRNYGPLFPKLQLWKLSFHVFCLHFWLFQVEFIKICLRFKLTKLLVINSKIMLIHEETFIDKEPIHSDLSLHLSNIVRQNQVCCWSQIPKKSSQIWKIQASGVIPRQPDEPSPVTGLCHHQQASVQEQAPTLAPGPCLGGPGTFPSATLLYLWLRG